ncbi:hypothetical protein [Neptunicella sp. SCSIO 80796]|uniref:hypothetical protein n=1 Tax=Neptunicella plasticusilytica TaxID=3117012 RepID=UPI003A4DA6BB
MKNLFATFIISAISVNPLLAIEQKPAAQSVQRYVFSYDFINQQDPQQRQYQHLSQELDYQLTLAVQQDSLANVQQVGRDMQRFSSAENQQLASLSER